MNINDMTLEEFQAMENFGHGEIFNDVVIVPTNEIHDSGFRCMKFILVRRGEIVGCVSGWSDVVHPNGIGNYGNNLGFISDATIVPKMDLKIDCLKASGCVRLMFGRNTLQCDSFIGSDFLFYLTGDKV